MSYGTLSDPDAGRFIASSGDELALRLCALVGADPGETTSIAVEGDHNGAVVRWDGWKRVPLDDIAKAIADAGPVRPVRGRPGSFEYETRHDAGPAGGP